MTLERSSYQMSSDRTNELLSKERQLFALADVWSDYKEARSNASDGEPEFIKLALKLDTVVKEMEPTEPMCVYCGWGGEGLAEHERDCKPMWVALEGFNDDPHTPRCNINVLGYSPLELHGGCTCSAFIKSEEDNDDS